MCIAFCCSKMPCVWPIADSPEPASPMLGPIHISFHIRHLPSLHCVPFALPHGLQTAVSSPVGSSHCLLQAQAFVSAAPSSVCDTKLTCLKLTNTPTCLIMISGAWWHDTTRTTKQPWATGTSYDPAWCTCVSNMNKGIIARLCGHRNIQLSCPCNVHHHCSTGGRFQSMFESSQQLPRFCPCPTFCTPPCVPPPLLHATPPPTTTTTTHTPHTHRLHSAHMPWAIASIIKRT